MASYLIEVNQDIEINSKLFLSHVTLIIQKRKDTFIM